MKHRCEYCGYTAKESAFLDGICPACCRDVESGEKSKNSIPTVFHKPDPGTIEEKELWLNSGGSGTAGQKGG